MSYSAIHIWGDSIALGVTLDDATRRYALCPERASERLKRAVNVPVLNRAVMGATAPDGLARFENAPRAEGALCVIEYGGNDCDLDWAAVAANPREPIAAKTSLTRYRDALCRFAERARARGMKPLMVTPPPLGAPRYFRWVTRGLDAARVLLALGDVQHIYRWQERYTIAMRDAARQTGCELWDVRDVFLAQPDERDLMSADGIHPSADGHRLIADAALARLAERDGALLGGTV